MKRKPINTLNDLNGSEWLQNTKSWFILDGKPSDFTPDIIRHPAAYPPALAKKFIRFFTKTGATVLDPFVGCGSTLEAAYKTGRAGYGIELNKEFYESCRRRVAKMTFKCRFIEGLIGPRVFHGDAADCMKFDVPPVDLVMTSPPYWNILKRKPDDHIRSRQKYRRDSGLPTDYGNDPKDLGGNLSYFGFIETLAGVFQTIHANLLKPGGFIVLVIQNTRMPEGHMKPTAWDTAVRLGEFMVLKQEYIWCQNQKRLGCWGYPSTYVSNLHHHTVLVFQKRKITEPPAPVGPRVWP
jgi:DNA modification methylase